MRNRIVRPTVFHAIALSLMVVIPAARVFGEGGTWMMKAPIPTLRAGLAIGVVNGVVYAVGGDTGRDPYLSVLEAYDPTTNSWTTKAPMPTARSGLGVGVVNGILYAVGGISKHVAGRILNTVEAYDSTTNTWTTKAPMLTPRWGLAVGVVNGILYAVGGSGGPGGDISAPLNTVEAYEPATNTWTTKAPMPTTPTPFVTAFASGVANGILYTVGGSCCNPGHGSTFLGTVTAYNPTTNTWTTKASMPTPRQYLAVGVVNQILYAAGGAAPDGPVSAVEAYDPATNLWTRKTPMPSVRSLHAVGVTNGVLYVVGGLTVTKVGTPQSDLVVRYTRDLLAFKPQK